MATIMSGDIRPPRVAGATRVTHPRTLAHALAKSRASAGGPHTAPKRLIERLHDNNLCEPSAPTLDETELARRLADALNAVPPPLPPQPDPPRPHVSLSIPPEIVTPIVFEAVDDEPVPPPLPVPASQLLPSSLPPRSGLPAVTDDQWLHDEIEPSQTSPSHLDAPWIKRGRRTRLRQPGTIMAWIVTVLVVLSTMVAAMVGLIGSDRVLALGAEIGDVAWDLWSAARAFVASLSS